MYIFEKRKPNAKFQQELYRLPAMTYKKNIYITENSRFMVNEKLSVCSNEIKIL